MLGTVEVDGVRYRVSEALMLHTLNPSDSVSFFVTLPVGAKGFEIKTDAPMAACASGSERKIETGKILLPTTSCLSA